MALLSILSSPWKQKALVFGGGALVATTLAPIYFPIFFVCPVFNLLLKLILTANPRKSFWIGWWFGFGYFTVGLYWIAFALGVDLDRFAWMIPFSVFGLPSLLAFFIAPIFALTSAAKLKGTNCILLFAVLWTVSEWVRGHFFTGFPWNLIGYCWMDYLPMAQSLSLFGTYGLSFFTILWACAFALEPRKRLVATVGIYALFLGLLAFGMGRLAFSKVETFSGITLRLVQPCIPQKLKWEKDQAEENLQTLLNLSTQNHSNATPTVTIWPESATSFYLANDAQRRIAILKSLNLKGILLTGSARGMKIAPDDIKLWNSLIAIDPLGAILGIYDKSHLVPFGEYIPLRSILPSFIHKITPGAIDYSEGEGIKTINIAGLPPFSPLICYEVIFPRRGQAPGWPDARMAIKYHQ